MVRAHVKQTPEEKKETRKPKAPKAPKETRPPKQTAAPKEPKPPKEGPTAGAWPCKIDGCTKQFAREADLKRHQRTTKGHSVPSFACPQCDAAFTRTDALRRHQKSRHNGVVIEATPTDSTAAGNSAVDAAGPSQAAKSRSGSPRANNMPHPPHLNPGGPSSYYRPHVLQSAGIHTQPQDYPQVGLPTSATRGGWAPGEVQAEHYPGPNGDAGPGPGPEYFTAHEPYYRPEGGDDPSQGQSRTEHGPQSENTGPVIDPALEGPVTVNGKGAQGQMMSMEMTQAAVAAVLEATGMIHSAAANASAVSHASRVQNSVPRTNQESDGDVMLNASELLTQESLASPPSS